MTIPFEWVYQYFAGNWNSWQKSVDTVSPLKAKEKSHETPKKYVLIKFFHNFSWFFSFSSSFPCSFLISNGDFICHPLCYQRCMYSGIFFLMNGTKTANHGHITLVLSPAARTHIFHWMTAEKGFDLNVCFAIVIRSWRQHFPERYLRPLRTLGSFQRQRKINVSFSRFLHTKNVHQHEEQTRKAEQEKHLR